MALLAAAAALACGGDKTTEPQVPISVALTVTPVNPRPGAVINVSATATPPTGTRLRALRLALGGIATFTDSVTAIADGSVSISRNIKLPLSIGSVSVLATATATNGTKGSNQTQFALADSTPPTLTGITITPAQGTPLQPGDSIRAQFNASDDVSLRYAVIRITGAFQRTDSTAFTSQTNGFYHALAVAVPSNAPLNGTVSIAIEAMDIGGNVVRSPTAQYNVVDVTPPIPSVTISGARANGAFSPGDTATITVSAVDNRALRSYGFAINGLVAGDSVAASGTTATRTVRVPLGQTTGSYTVTAFATDSAGNRSSLGAAAFVVDSRTRRPIVSIAIAGGYDIAYDAKRGRIYVSQPDSSRIAVAAADASARYASYVTIGAPRGIDLSLGGDTLVVALYGTQQLGMLHLASGTLDTVRVITDAGLSRSPDHLRVAADGRAIFSVTFAGSGYGGSLYDFDLATARLGAGVTTTESVPLAASMNQQRVYALIDDSCCPEEGLYYDALRGKFTGNRGTVSYYFPGVASDFSGAHFLVGTQLFGSDLSLITTLSAGGAGYTRAVALSPDGAYGYFASSTAILKVRASDNTVVDTFTLGEEATHLKMLPDGVTLLATSPTKLYVIDLW